MYTKQIVMCGAGSEREESNDEHLYIFFREKKKNPTTPNICMKNIIVSPFYDTFVITEFIVI